MKTRHGFTLIELLLVIGIIAILAAIVIVAINPSKQLGDARNAQRRSDVNTILNAYWQYAIDNAGAFQPTATVDDDCEIPAAGSPNQVCNIGVGSDDADADCSDGFCSCDAVNCIYSRHLSGTYIVGMPTDPNHTSTGAHVQYRIEQQAGGRLRISAPGAERSETIAATR